METRSHRSDGQPIRKRRAARGRVVCLRPADACISASIYDALRRQGPSLIHLHVSVCGSAVCVMMLVSWVLLLPLCWGIPVQTQPSPGAVGLSQGVDIGVKSIATSLRGSLGQQVLHEPARDRESDISGLSPSPPATPTHEKPGPTEPSPSHGAFLTTIATIIASTKSETKLPPIEPLATHYVRTLRKAQFPTTLLDRYAHELVALGLLLLVPVTLGVVELAERIGHYYCEEEFPDRGREPKRCFGRERRLRRELRDVREKRVEEERRWWRR